MILNNIIMKIYLKQLKNKSIIKTVSIRTVFIFLAVLAVFLFTALVVKFLINIAISPGETVDVPGFYQAAFLFSGINYIIFYFFFGTRIKEMEFLLKYAFLPIKKAQLLIADVFISNLNIVAALTIFILTLCYFFIPSDGDILSFLLYLFWVIFYVNIISVFCFCAAKYFYQFIILHGKIKSLLYASPVFLGMMAYIYYYTDFLSIAAIKQFFSKLSMFNPAEYFIEVVVSIVQSEYTYLTLKAFFVCVFLYLCALLLLFASYQAVRFNMARSNLSSGISSGAGERCLWLQRIFFKDSNLAILKKEIMYFCRSFSIKIQLLISFGVAFYLINYIRNNLLKTDATPKVAGIFLLLAPLAFCNIIDYIILYENKSLLANYFLPISYKNNLLFKHFMLLICYIIMVVLNAVFLRQLFHIILPLEYMLLFFIIGFYCFTFNNAIITFDTLANPYKVSFHTIPQFTASKSGKFIKLIIHNLYIIPVLAGLIFLNDMLYLYFFSISLLIISLFLYWLFLDKIAGRFWAKQEEYFQIFWEA